MRKFKKIAALAMACTVCLTVNVTAASYADKPVSALTVIADIKDVVLEKDVISPGESTKMTVEWDVGTTFMANFYSSDTNIVQIEDQTVDSCTLTGVSEGTAIITVSNNVYSKTVEVTVKDESDRFTYEIKDGSIIFSNYAGNAMMSYVISSNIGYDYDMICEKTEAIFTPNENGKYVVTVEEYCEEIFDYSIMDGHFHYFYPVLTNYTVNVTDDEITVNRKGSCSYYSEEQVEDEKNMIADIAIDANGNVPAPDFTVYAEGTENDMYALNGAYFSFLNGVLPDYDNNGRYKTYITTLHNEYKTESYFCLNAPNSYEDPIVQVSDNELAEVMKKLYTSSSIDGNLQNAALDEMKFYRVKALKDGDVTVTAYFDDVKEYALEIKDGVFKRVNKSEDIALKGDANGDGIFSVADLVMLQDRILGRREMTADQLRRADMNDDGAINVIDAVIMKRKLMEQIKPSGSITHEISLIPNSEKFIDTTKNNYIITSTKELGDYFFSIYGDILSCDVVTPETETFITFLNKYNEEFFENNVLLLKPLYQLHSNGNVPYTIGNVHYVGDTLYVEYTNNTYGLGIEVFFQYLAQVVVPKSMWHAEKVEWVLSSAVEPKAVLTVYTTYDGYGVDGQPLGSGEFTQFFDVAEGDILYEDEWGYWHLNVGSSLLDERQIICKIISVDPKSITVSMEGFYINENEYIDEETEITLAYGDIVNVFSKFPVCDGINYEHQITFEPIDFTPIDN